MRLQDGFLGDSFGTDMPKRKLSSLIKRSVKENRIAWFVTWSIDVDIISELADKAGVDWLYDGDTGEARFFEFM